MAKNSNRAFFRLGRNLEKNPELCSRWWINWWIFVTRTKGTTKEAIKLFEELRMAQYRFTLQAGEKGLELPTWKASTFRGAFGHAFKRLSCIHPGKFSCSSHEFISPWVDERLDWLVWRRRTVDSCDRKCCKISSSVCAYPSFHWWKWSYRSTSNELDFDEKWVSSSGNPSGRP